MQWKVGPRFRQRRGRDVGFLAGELLDADGNVVAVASATVQIRSGMLRASATEA